MAWTLPKTWTNEPFTAADLNTHIRDNLEVLKNPASAIYDMNEGTDLALTSTSWADMDATEGKLQHTITTNGGDVMVGFRSTINVSTNTIVYLDVSVDGADVAGGDGLIGELINTGSNAVDGTIQFFHIIQGLAAGTYIFKMRYKVGGGTVTFHRSAGTSTGNTMGQFWVREIS